MVSRDTEISGQVESNIDPKERTEESANLLQHISKRRWTVAALLFAAFTINYFDRQIVSVLKPILMQSPEHNGIGLTEQGYGYIAAAFQIAYGFGLFSTGRLIDRIGSRKGYMLIMALWSAVSAAHAFASNLVHFVIARVLLGIGESGNQPAAVKSVAEWFPPSERALASGIFNCGANIGAILATLVVPFMALHYGWRSAFYLTGILGIIWLILWFRYYRNIPRPVTAEQANGKAAPARISYKKLLQYRQTWAFALAKGITDPMFGFFLFWLPDFFGRKYGLESMGTYLTVIYISASVGSLVGGWIPAPMMKLGLSVQKARLYTMLVFAIMVTPVFLVTQASSPWVMVGLISLAILAHQGWGANIFSLVADMFPSTEAASIAGIGGTVSALTGAAFSVFVGYLLGQNYANYSVVFSIGAVVYILAWFVIVLLAPGLRKVEV